MMDDDQGERAREQFHERITQADACLAVRALTPQKQIAQHRDVFPGANGMATLGTAGVGGGKCHPGFGLGRLLPQKLQTLGSPLLLHHLREAVNNDIQKTADKQAKDGAHDKEENEMLVEDVE